MQRIIVGILLALGSIAFILPAQSIRTHAPLIKHLLPHESEVAPGPAFTRVPSSSSLEQQANLTASSTPQAFPFQGPFGFTNPSVYAPVALPSDQIVMFYASGSYIYSAATTDTGSTWSSSPILVYQSPSTVLSSLAAFRTSTGRLLIVWNTTDRTYRIYSDNDGTSWSVADTIIAGGGNGGFSIFEPEDGTLWFFYNRAGVTTRTDIYYRISTNNGSTWSTEQTFLATDFNEFSGSVVSGGGSTLVAFSVDNSVNERSNLYRRVSTNSGSSWSAPSVVFADTLIKSTTSVIRRSDGTLAMISTVYSRHFTSPFYVGGFYPNYDLYSSTSTDSGSTWSPLSPITQYAGRDITPKAVQIGTQTFVSFGSSREIGDVMGNRVFTLVAETATDNDTPPNLFYYSTGASDPSGKIQINAQVSDDNTVAATSVSYSVNGGAQTVVTMFDDGAHGDYQSGDLVYGGLIGPLQLDDQVLYTFSVTDNSANSISPGAFFFTVPGIHNAGNIALAIGGNSRLGTSGTGNSVTWPRTGGQDYLYVGGFWAGAMIGGQPRVSDYHYGEVDWQRTVSTPFTLASGISDQDGDVTYDDLLSGNPVGLRVRQMSYQWAATTRDDFVIFKYTVTNAGTNGVLDSVYAAIWLDPDVPPAAGSNLVGYDPARNLMYLWSGVSPGAYFGLALLGSESPRTAYFYGPFTDNPDNVRFQYMTTGIPTPPSAVNDYRTVLTAPPFRLQVSDSQTVAFGIVMGNNLAELQQNTDTMRAVYAVALVTGVEEELPGIVPKTFSLEQNYPNPFNPSTAISYQLPAKAGTAFKVMLRVYDILGRQVATLVNEEKPAGVYKAEWNASVPSGVYFYRLEAVGRDGAMFVETKRMLLVR